MIEIAKDSIEEKYLILVRNYYEQKNIEDTAKNTKDTIKERLENLLKSENVKDKEIEDVDGTRYNLQYEQKQNTVVDYEYLQYILKQYERLVNIVKDTKKLNVPEELLTEGGNYISTYDKIVSKVPGKEYLAIRKPRGVKKNTSGKKKTKGPDVPVCELA